MSDVNARLSAVQAAVDRMCLNLRQTWLAYFAMGGSLSEGELRRYLRDDRRLDDYEYDMLAAGINDQFQLLGKEQPLVYSHEL